MKVQRLPQYAIAMAILVVALAAGVPVSTLLVTLLVLACPLMMLLMMGGLLGGRGGSQHGSQGGSDPRDRNSEKDHDHRPPSGPAVAGQASPAWLTGVATPSTTHSTGDDADG